MSVLSSAISHRTWYNLGIWRDERCGEDLKAAYTNVNWKDGKLLNRTSKKDLEEQAAKKLLRIVSQNTGKH